MTLDLGMVVPSFPFTWSLFGPFPSWRRIENSFYIENPDLTHWSVELLSLTRSYNSGSYMCSLKYDNIFLHEEATAERLEILVSLNDVVVKRNLIFDYPFNEDTRYAHRFQVDIENYDTRELNILQIQIQIDIKRDGIIIARVRRDDTEISLLIGGETYDMTCLSNDLQKCRETGAFRTMGIFSREQTESFVHRFILQERWINLFRMHDFNEHTNSIETNIPERVLANILNYMYTGRIYTDQALWGDTLYVTQFFQVIFLYKVFHLYGTLRRSVGRMSRDTIKYADDRKVTVILHYIRDTYTRRQSITLPIFIYSFPGNPIRCSVHTFQFSVHVKPECQTGPWLSYSVRSQTEIPFNLQVNLEIPEITGLARLVNSSDYNIPANGRVESEPLLFLGGPNLFYGHYPDPEDQKMYIKLLFRLTFHNDESGVSIWQYYNDGELVSKPEEVLSRHMRNILNKQLMTDLVVQPIGTDSGVPCHRIHKAIFNARVPGWRRIFKPNLPEDATLPNTIMLPLSNESYHLVVSYIYTGKMLNIPPALRQEILDFAFRSEFYSLLGLAFLPGRY